MLNLKIKNKYLIFLWIPLSVSICFMAYTKFYKIDRGASLISQNDEWEHQSLAVNYSKGLGTFKLGAFSKFEDYHIDSYDWAFPFLKKLFIKYPTEYYHRAIGFSIITGILYKYTDTRPYNLRIFNFILIILSWMVLCFSHYTFGNNKKLNIWLYLVLPIYIILNFSYIDLIGDDTLIIFSLSFVFISILYWWKLPNIISSICLLSSILLSVFIKSTLIFIPILLFLYCLFYKKKKHAVSLLVLNSIIVLLVLVYSSQLNKRHHEYKYFSQQLFHKDMVNSMWNNEDSLFIKENNLTYIKDNDYKNKNENEYKIIASYLFERQFYTARDFILSGQSLFLLLDGNNESAASFCGKRNGNWAPIWKFNKNSFYSNYNENTSPNLSIIKFYLHKPYMLPIIIYYKWYAGYTWSYLFILLSTLQLLLYFIKKKDIKSINIIFILFICILIIHIFLRQFMLSSFFVIMYLFSLYSLFKENKSSKKFHYYFFTSFIVLYFIFLTTLVFGLDRYTGVANAFYLICIVQLVDLLVSNLNNRCINSE